MELADSRCGGESVVEFPVRSKQDERKMLLKVEEYVGRAPYINESQAAEKDWSHSTVDASGWKHGNIALTCDERPAELLCPGPETGSCWPGATA